MDYGAYISGYVDGEGCFTVSIRRRPTLRIGWEVRPSFSVGQREDRAQTLRILREYFGCGEIRLSRRDRVLHYETRSISDLTERILPHFLKYPLLSEKQGDLERFIQICEIIGAGKHRTERGLQEIIALALQMRSTTSRRARMLKTILSKFEGEGIVYATSNRGKREVLSRTKGVTTGGLSQRGAR